MKFDVSIHPTYRQQFDKLTAAYISNEVEPYSPCACFIGNLLNNNPDWIYGRDNEFIIRSASWSDRTEKAFIAIKREGKGLYEPEEIFAIELKFLATIDKFTKAHNLRFFFGFGHIYRTHPNFEKALFLAFEACLDELKVLHESKGEVIDEVPEFKQRQLTTA